MKLLVCGSRTYTNYAECERILDVFCKENDITEIIHGGAHGADSCGGLYAARHNIPTTCVKPDWSLGRGAGFIRNITMLEMADHVVAFWDGKSRGTKHTIEQAQKRSIPVTLIINTNP